MDEAFMKERALHKAVSDEHADVLLVKLAISVRLSDMETWSFHPDAAFTVPGIVIDRRVDGILRFPFCISAASRKLVDVGGRFLGPEGAQLRLRGRCC